MAEKETILFIHGFMGSMDDWSEIVQSLPDYNCLAIDLPGHSGQLLAFETLEHYLIHLNEILDVTVHMVGYSMGGRIAMQFALRYPDKIKSLCIISASPGIEPAEAQSRLELEAKWAIQMGDDFEGFLERWYEMPIFCGLDEKLKSALIKKRLKQQPLQLIRAMDLFSPAHAENIWPQLGKINSPFLYLAGELDEKYATMAKAIRGNYTRISVSIIDDCSHAVHLEKPNFLIKKLTNFMA